VQSKVASQVAALIRLASWVICLIVIASFVIFVVEQAKGASSHQQDVLNGTAAASGSQPSGTETSTSTPPPAHESTVHKTIDEASEEVTSPFSGILSGSKSLWLYRIVNLLIALAIYGFGLGYIARRINV
jgi:hypothetical protein